MAFAWRTWWGMASLGAVSLVMCSHGTPPAALRTTPSDKAPAVASAALPSPDAAAPSSERSPLPEGAIDAAVQQAMDSQSLPGGVVVIGRHDRVLFRRAYGFRELLPERVAMTLDTVFDLASLTKPIATATSIMVLFERGAIGLDDLLVKYVPECDKEGKRAITLRQLLLHVSGLPSDIAKDDFAHGRTEAIRHICETPLRGVPGATSIYSDLGFILLEEVVRARHVARAAGVRRGERSSRRSGCATRSSCPRASSARGPRGPSSSTASGASAWCTIRARTCSAASRGTRGSSRRPTTSPSTRGAILGGGAVDGQRILSAGTVATMIAPYDVPGGIRALGWDVESPWRGEGLSPTAVGHFGFTGHRALDRSGQGPLRRGPDQPRAPRRQGRLEAARRAHQHARRAGHRPAGRARRAAPTPRPSVLTGDRRAARRGLRAPTGETRRPHHQRERPSARRALRRSTSCANAPGVKLVALFTPEHGLDATRLGKHRRTARRANRPARLQPLRRRVRAQRRHLAGIDTLVFDVQDVGTRFYTYASTMRRAMEAAREHDLRFVVLDRPDPIDGIDVAGPVLVPPPASFVNYHSLPDPARDDDRRARHALQRRRPPRGGALGRADARLAARVVRRRDGAALGQPVAQPAQRRRGPPLPGRSGCSRPPTSPSVAGPTRRSSVSARRGSTAPPLAAALAAEGLAGVRLRARGLHPRSRSLRRPPLPRCPRHRPRARPVRAGADRPRHRARACAASTGANGSSASSIGWSCTRRPSARSTPASRWRHRRRPTRPELAAFMTKREKYLLYGSGECAPAAH